MESSRDPVRALDQMWKSEKALFVYMWDIILKVWGLHDVRMHKICAVLCYSWKPGNLRPANVMDSLYRL